MHQNTARTSMLHLALIALISWGCYASTLAHSFHLDDYPNITENTFIKDLSYFASPRSAHDLPLGQYLERRYVGYLSFALNYRAGGLNVQGYHVVNITIHMLCAMSLYGLTLTLMRARSIAGAHEAALVAALIFAAHPVQTQAVTYIVQRHASMAALFVVASMLTYALARLATKVSPRAGYYIASIACALLAVKTKENAAVLPALILMIEWAFFDAPTWKRRALLSAPFWAIALLVPLALYMSQAGGGVEMALRERTETSRWIYFLTQLRAMATYLRLIVLPVGQSVEYDFPLSTGMGARELMAGLLHLSVIASGIYMLVRKRGAWLVPGFGICLYYIAHAPESSVVPILDVIFEHRLYLPMAGACMAIGAGAAWAMQGRARAAAIAICAMVILALAGMTYERNKVWATELTLWQDAAQKATKSARAAHNLGNSLLLAGRTEEAAAEFNRTLEIDPKYYMAMNSLGVVLLNQGRTGEAAELFKRALEVSPDYLDAMNNLASAYYIQKQNELAAALMFKAIEMEPRYAPAYYTLGLAFEGMGKVDAALEAFMRAVEIAPDYGMAHAKLAFLYSALGDEQASARHRALAQGAR